MLTQTNPASQFLGALAHRTATDSQPAEASHFHIAPPQSYLLLQAGSRHPLYSNTCANQYMNPFPPIHHSQTQPHHGIKRSAPADEIEQSSNISTHFKKLRLNQSRWADLATISPVGVSLRSNSKSPILDAEQPHTWQAATARYPNGGHHAGSAATMTANNAGLPATPIIPPRADDFMPLDETPHKIYIPDLDAEIAAIESQEALDKSHANFFLADVDKNISKIPDHVLRGAGGHHDHPHHSTTGLANKSANEQALVLYRDPISISVPEEEDAVRKVIIAARREAREKMRREHEDSMSVTLLNRYSDPSSTRDGHTMETNISSSDFFATSAQSGGTSDVHDAMNNDSDDEDAMDIS